VPSVLLIDHYDSFTHNLKHYLILSGADVTVCPHDDARVFPLSASHQAIVLSPGPSAPHSVPQSRDIVKRFCSQKPMLGVCLGMQIINEVFSGTTLKAAQPVHGKVSSVTQTQDNLLFNGLPPSFTAARYHSLICGKIHPDLRVTAQNGSVPMAFEHTNFPLFGVQFHPESFMTPLGQQIIDNFTGLIP
jgi:anthranilate synthase component 2